MPEGAIGRECSGYHEQMFLKVSVKSETAGTQRQKMTVPCQKTLATAEKINYNFKSFSGRLPP
jgi:hypothetical protein